MHMKISIRRKCLRRSTFQSLHMDRAKEGRGQKSNLLKNKHNDQRMTPYGITVAQLDTLILEMCQTYNYQWSVISAALYKEHHITMSHCKIKNRYRNKLDKNLNMNEFSYEEEKGILKMFFLEGKSYSIIRTKFVDRGAYMLRALVEVHSKSVIRNLQVYLWKEINQLPAEMQLGNTDIDRTELVRCFMSHAKLPWEHNKSFFKIIYFFMVSKVSDFPKIPKELAMLVYKRLVQLKKNRDQEKQKYLKRIDPSLAPQTVPMMNKYKFQKNIEGGSLDERLSEQTNQSKGKKRGRPLRMGKRMRELYQFMESSKKQQVKTQQPDNRLYYSQDIADQIDQEESSLDISIPDQDLQLSFEQESQIKREDDLMSQLDSDDFLYRGLHEVNLGNIQIKVSRLPRLYKE